MYELYVLLFFCLVCQCIADNIYFYKSLTRKRGSFSTVFQNASSVKSAMDCGRYCKEKEECMSASFCGESYCHLSNASASDVLHSLEVDENCIHMDLNTICRNKTKIADCKRVGWCPPGYSRVGKLCVMYLKNGTYASANNTCFAKDGHLVTVDSRLTMLTLLDMCRAKGCHHIWIDGKNNLTWDLQPLQFAEWVPGKTLQEGECPVICTNENAMKSEKCNKETNEAYCQSY